MKHMLKISAVYRSGKAEIPIHYTIWADVEQALLNYDFACETIWPVTNSCFFLFLTIKLEINIIRQSSKWPHFSRSQWKMKINTNFAISTFARVKKNGLLGCRDKWQFSSKKLQQSRTLIFTHSSQSGLQLTYHYRRKVKILVGSNNNHILFEGKVFF